VTTIFASKPRCMNITSLFYSVRVFFPHSIVFCRKGDPLLSLLEKVTVHLNIFVNRFAANLSSPKSLFTGVFHIYLMGFMVATVIVYMHRIAKCQVHYITCVELWWLFQHEVWSFRNALNFALNTMLPHVQI
jgi:hypothetical protein